MTPPAMQSETPEPDWLQDWRENSPIAHARSLQYIDDLQRRLRKAEETLELVTEQLQVEQQSSKSCPSCGLLWPEHANYCGIWVKRDRAEAAERRAQEKK